MYSAGSLPFLKVRIEYASCYYSNRLVLIGTVEGEEDCCRANETPSGHAVSE
jgi:hypothetical protein